MDPSEYVPLPTRDSLTVTVEDDGGFTFHISVKRATLEKMRREHRAELEQLASLLMAMQSEMEEKPAKRFD